jgi:Ser/Thr protein kinase RdoA (MazF antagonist)
MDNKLPLSHPIKTKDDNICAKWKGKIIIVKKYIDGRVIKNNEKLKNSALYQLGKYHGIIHSTKKLNFLPKGYPYKYAKKFFSSVNKESREYKQAQETLNYLEEKGFDKANFPRGFIHGDLHSENIIIKRGKIVCLLDFEESHIGPFIFDLGLSILEECISDGKIIKRKLKALIAGYESYRKLTDVEKKYLAVSPLIIGVYGLSYRVKVKKQGIKESKSLTYFIKKYVDYFNKVRDIE